MLDQVQLKRIKNIRNTMNVQLLTLFTYCHLENMTQSNYINWPTMYGVQTNYDIVTKIYTEIVVLIFKESQLKHTHTTSNDNEVLFYPCLQYLHCLIQSFIIAFILRLMLLFNLKSIVQ